MKHVSTYSTAGLIVLALMAGPRELGAQEIKALVCSTCQVENALINKHCVSCGESLADEATQLQAETQRQARYMKRFISERVDPPRLYSVPIARVLGSMDIRLMGGGSFGVATDKSFLGTVGIGLGDIAEVEFSTVGMVNNISRGNTVFPTSAFKLLLIPENRWHIPTLAIAVRSSANWQDVVSDRGVLAADKAMYEGGITDIGYDTRFTTMFGVTTIRLWAFNLHAGLSLTDVRIKDLSVYSQMTGSQRDTEEKQKNLQGGFVGFDIEANPQTKLMLEVKTVSNYEYNVDSMRIDVSESYLAIGGVRFFFSRWLSTDVGLWYQSDFKGIADMQIKIGLNLFIPGGSLGRKFQAVPKERLKSSPQAVDH